jgi:hypothetical protein
MRVTFQKPKWDHTVTGRKGRASGKAAHELAWVRSRERPPGQGKLTGEPRTARLIGFGGGGQDPKYRTAAFTGAATLQICYHL